MSYKDFSRYFRCKRIEMGYTQYEFARMLTLKQSHYNKIENGLIEPSFGILQLICIYLEIDLTELLELKKPIENRYHYFD